MKKKSPSRRGAPPVAPAGLMDAFKLIHHDGATSHAAAQFASEAYPHAQRLIALLHAERDDQDSAFAKELERATDTFFGLSPQNPPAHTEPQLAGEAGFKVGFAVCWLLLNRLQGGVQ